MLFSLVLIFVDNRFDYLAKVRYYASYVIIPVHWIAAAPTSVYESLGSTVQTRSSLVAENERLREQVITQQYQLQKLAYLTAENARLNALQNASTSVNERMVRVQLVGESADPFTKKILINKGSRDDVYVGQPVLDAYGLFGMVSEVEAYNSWVLLITDPLHATPVQVNRNGERAVAYGSQDSLHRMTLENVPDTKDIVVGDILETSGLGQRFPAGYPVGVVNSVIHDPGQPFAIVTVEPTAQFDRSRNLLLIF